MIDDPYHNLVQPRAGFVYPKAGECVMARQDYKTPSGEVVPEGTIGTLGEPRLPGTYEQHHGYIGCVVGFPDLKSYPSGLVIPWDVVSDPERFRFDLPAEFRRSPYPFETTLRREFQLRGAVQWATQLQYDRPWYNPPLPKESKMFIYFLREDKAEIGHYCVPLRVIEIFDEPRFWFDGFLKNLQMRAIDLEIPQYIFDWQS